MDLFLGVLSAILGVINVIQWIVGYISGNGLRAKAQADYNHWYRIAELADEIHADPGRAVELSASVKGIADSMRTEIVAYSRERLDFRPEYESPSNPKPQSCWPL